eukprot:550436-Hanusia_phi.AAC.1
MSVVLFLFIEKTIGIRVSAEVEEAGLDVSEHGIAPSYEQQPQKNSIPPVVPMQEMSSAQQASMEQRLPEPMPVLEQPVASMQEVPMLQEGPPPISPESYTPVYASNPVEATNMQGSLGLPVRLA